VIIPEHFAFGRAGVAYRGAQRAVFLGEAGVRGHIRNGHFAHPSAFHEHFDAPCSRLYVGFVQTRVHALITGSCAFVASVDALLESGVNSRQHCHNLTSNIFC
jgi:hypothetical protein